ncbi:MAG: HAMP domain-containing histidine kinase [Phycisphaerae bacterium]|nr:HAMP domain-containing histidine kinase [Phycisphaerae bacterium]
MEKDPVIPKDQAASAHENLAELSRIVGGLAHEIKNPLSTINLNLNLLSEDLCRYDDEEHRRLVRRLERVKDEATRLKQTLNDFLRYAGKVELSLRQVDLRDIVGQLHDFFAPQADAARIVLRISAPAEAVLCNIDENLFKQAMLNLLINSADAMDSGGELLVKIARESSHAVVEVIDTGSGIAEDKLESIFQPYFSTKSGGSGLGLPTARRILREHGGSLRVESEVGKGTRFILTLPLAGGARS